MDSVGIVFSRSLKGETRVVRSYRFTAKFLHWTFIAVFAFGVINQVDEVEELESPTLLAGEVILP